MIFERITTGGLAHHSYFIASGSEAIVVDPRRDVDVYLALAERHRVRIRDVLETHRNEDLVSGACELAARTDARILHGRGLPFGYGEFAEDGQTLALGKLRVRAIATPGHTAESMTYAITDTDSGDDAVIALTGDALFVGEVGRTDLYGAERREELAGWLHDSIFRRILPLGDGVILAPAHGGGSVCGGDILDRDVSTLGFERRHNPRLQATERERFVLAKRDERMVIPPYFQRMETYNLEGPPLLGHLPRPAPLDVAEFARRVAEGAVVVDVRSAQAYAGAHLPDSFSLWAEGLSLYAGWVLPLDRPLLLVGEAATAIEPLVRALVRVGFDDVAGYLAGGFEAWPNAGRPFERTGVVTAEEAREKLRHDALLIDVRNVDEWRSGVIEGAMLMDVADLARRLDELPRDRPILTMCSVGHRGSIGASLLQRAGFGRVSNVLGGMTAWRAQGLPVGRGPSAARISRLSWLTDRPTEGATPRRPESASG